VAGALTQDPDRVPGSANLRRSGRATKTTTKATAAATATTSGNRRRSTRSATGDATAGTTFLPPKMAQPASPHSQPPKFWARDVWSQTTNVDLSPKTSLQSNKSTPSSHFSPTSTSKNTSLDKTSPQIPAPTTSPPANTPNNLPIPHPELAQKLGCDPSDTAAAARRLAYVNAICEANGYPLKEPFDLIPADVCNMLITAVTEGVEWGWLEDDSRRVLVAICHENTAAAALVEKETNQHLPQLEMETTPQPQQPVSPNKRKTDVGAIENPEDHIPGRTNKKYKVASPEETDITKIAAMPVITPLKSQRVSSYPVARVASPVAKVTTPVLQVAIPAPQVATPLLHVATPVAQIAPPVGKVVTLTSQVASPVAQVPSPLPTQENMGCISAPAAPEETYIPASMHDDDPTVATGLTIEEIFDNLVARCADLV
jgi:hypothetical protein